jgi:hypothetical protein
VNVVSGFSRPYFIRPAEYESALELRPAHRPERGLSGSSGTVVQGSQPMLE